jgi:hypothetical protein
MDAKESIPPAYVAWRAGTQPYSYSVPSPHRLFKNSISEPEFVNVSEAQKSFQRNRFRLHM